MSKMKLEFDLPDEIGWDGHGSHPPDARAVDTVKYLHLTPMSNEGLLLELHAGGADIEIEIDRDGKVAVVSAEWRRP